MSEMSQELGQQGYSKLLEAMLEELAFFTEPLLGRSGAMVVARRNVQASKPWENTQLKIKNEINPRK